MKVTERVSTYVRIDLETGTDATLMDWVPMEESIRISLNKKDIYVDVQQIDEFIEGLMVLRKHIDKETPTNG